MCYQVATNACHLCNVSISIFKECINGIYPDNVCKDYLEMYTCDNMIVPYIYITNPETAIYLCGSCADDVKYDSVITYYDKFGLLPTKTSVILNYIVSILRQNDEDICYYSVVRGYELDDAKLGMTIDDNSNISI